MTSACEQLQIKAISKANIPSLSRDFMLSNTQMSVILDVVNVFIQMACSVFLWPSAKQASLEELRWQRLKFIRVTFKSSPRRGSWCKETWRWRNLPINLLYCGLLLYFYFAQRLNNNRLEPQPLRISNSKWRRSVVLRFHLFNLRVTTWCNISVTTAIL